MKTLRVQHLDAAVLAKLKSLNAAAITEQLEVQREAYKRLRICSSPGCNTRIHRRFTLCARHEHETAEQSKVERSKKRYENIKEYHGKV